MKKFVIWLVLAVLFIASCTKTIYLPIHTTETVTVHDTTVLHTTDTLVKVPEVRLQDIVDVTDTLELRSSLALSRAWLDTTFNALRGTLVQNGKLPVQIVERERIVYRDSIRDREVPVPVEVTKEVRYVPWFVKVLAWLGGIGLLLGVGWLLRKFGVI